MLDADTTAKKLAMRQRIGATDPAAAYGGQVNYVEDTSAARTASDDATRSYGTHQHGLSLQDSLAWDNSDPKKLGVKDGGITAAKMASGVIPGRALPCWSIHGSRRVQAGRYPGGGAGEPSADASRTVSCLSAHRTAIRATPLN